MKTLEIKTMPFSHTSIDFLCGKPYSDYPVVYFLNNNTMVYIGETVAVRNRLKNHLNNSERKSLDKMTIIIHKRFNRSATYNLSIISWLMNAISFKIRAKQLIV